MEEFDAVEGPSGIPEFFRDPWGVLRRRWPWMLAVLLVGAGAATLFIATIPVTYEASTRLLLTSPRISEKFVRQTSVENIPEMLNAIVGEILSRDSLMAVAEAQNLAQRMEGVESPEQIVPWMRRSIHVDQDLEAETRDWRQGAYTTFILAIRYESLEPQLAADVANELARRFIAVHIERQERHAKLTTDFLRREAERAEDELARQRSEITDFKEAHRGELPSELGTKLARLERLQQQSQSLALQISDAEGRLLILENQQADPGTREKLLQELRVRLVQERTVYTDEHPNVTALRRQIEALEAEVAAEEAEAGAKRNAPDLSAAFVQRGLEAMRAQLREVEQEIRELDSAVATIPSRQEKLEALEQREALLLERYSDASRKLQEAELAENLQRAQQGVQVSRLDSAMPPLAPTRTRWKFAVLAAVAVLGASGMIAVLLEFLDTVIVTARQIEAETGMPPLGTVPRIR